MPLIVGKVFSLTHVRVNNSKGRLLMSIQIEDDVGEVHKFKLGLQEPTLIDDIAFTRKLEVFYQKPPKTPESGNDLFCYNRKLM